MKGMPQQTSRVVMRSLHIIEWVGLSLITVATMVAVGQEVGLMLANRVVLLQDILLLFIYLAIFTMAGLHFKSGKLPLRYPMYIAMVAIARYIIIGLKDINSWIILALCGGILVLAVAVLVIRYGHLRYPYSE